MENTRSLISRFGGLLLFLLAVVVVGLLVFFTVRSSDDDDNGPGAGETSDQAALSDGDSEPAVSDSPAERTAAGGEVAGSSDDDLPNTGPEDALLPAVGLGLLAWQTYNYRQSRRLARASRLL